MEVIINDQSLVGQYDEKSFFDYCATELIPILDDIEKLNGSILKEYETYNRFITAEYTVNDYLVKSRRSDPIIDRLKYYLIQLTRNPYWNDSIKTDSKKKYVCPISVSPNCITESYERDELLYSFDYSIFTRPFQKITCDGVDYSVRNFYTYDELKDHLSALGLITIWSSNSFIVPSLGYKFEVRSREENHKQAHFHMSKAEHKISLSIPDCDVLAGSTPDTNKIIAWALTNMEKIVCLWNKYHPELMVKI